LHRSQLYVAVQVRQRSLDEAAHAHLPEVAANNRIGKNQPGAEYDASDATQHEQRILVSPGFEVVIVFRHDSLLLKLPPLISYCRCCRILSTTDVTSFTASSTAAATGSLSPICPSSPPNVA